MDFKELIEKRRSVRSFSPDKTIAHELLEEILEEAQLAPSWKNSQAPRVYVAESPQKADMIRTRCLPSFNQKSSEHACAFVITTYVAGVSGFTAGTPDNERGNEWGAYDTGLRDAYLILAAANAGVDSLVMGIRDEAVLRKELSIPDTEEIVSVIALGYREVEPPFRPRKDLDEIAAFF